MAALRGWIVPLLLLLLTPGARAAAEQTPFLNISAQAVGQGPLGVAIGDFNGDGVPDLAVANSLDATVSVLLGNGDGSYQPGRVVSVGSWPGPIAAVDLNKDGKADLVVGNVKDATVDVLLSRGDGTFGAPTAYTVGTPVTIVAGDFNGDGAPDVAVSTVTPSLSGLVLILSGNGDGTLAAPRAVASYPDLAGPAGVAVADFNGDGALDLAITLVFNENIFSPSSAVDVLLGDGRGGFASRGLAAIAFSGPTSIVAGDFDGDGRPDLAVALSQTDNLAVLMGNGDGTFQPASYPSAGANPLFVVAGDLDGDGKVDLVAVNNVSSSLSVLRGNGDGSFQAPVGYPALGGPIGVSTADLNGDGKADVAVTNNLANTVQIFLGSPAGTLRSGSVATGVDPTAVAFGDFDGDGVPDMVVASETSKTVLVFLGEGGGQFRPFTTFLVPLPASSVQSIQVADFNNDGKSDLAISTDIGTLVLLGNGDGTFSFPQAGDGAMGQVLASDLDHDGNVDLVTAGSSVAVAMGHGDGTFSPSSSYVPGGNFEAAIGDFDGDGNLDIASVSGGAVIVSLGNGDGTFRGPVSSPTSVFALTLAVGDFNGDGIPDLAVGHGTPVFLLEGRVGVPVSGPVVILLGRGDGSFEELGMRATDSATSFVAADFNGDGIVDLAFSRYDTGTVGILQGRGDGSFEDAADYPVGFHPRALALADLDGDGVPDLVVVDATQPDSVSQPLGRVSVLHGNIPAGPPRSTTTRVVPSIATGVVGEPLTLTASVTGPVPPSGSVTFKENGAVLATAPLVGAQAQFTTQVTLGRHRFNAFYSGDGNLNGNESRPIAVTGVPASTTTAVTSSASPSKLGDGVTLTATVSPQYTGTATGTMDFYADGQPVGSSPLGGGAATVVIASLTMGTHTIAAEYEGDPNFASSLGTFKQKVGKAASTVTVTSSAAPASYGQPLAVLATVTDSAGITPTGVVVLVEGATVYGTVPLSAGVAQITLSTLTVGTHKITAQYGGDSLDSPSNGSFKQTVVGLPTASAVATSAQPAIYGQGVTFTADVSSSSGAPDGTVTFKSGSSVLGTAALTAGEARLTISTLVAGTRTITAIYSGSATFAASTATLQQIIEKAETTTTLGSSASPIAAGQAVTLSAVVSSAAAEIPTGSVTFKDGKTVLATAALVNGEAQIATPLLAAGSHTITAAYAASNDFAASKASMTEIVD
ncbi:MAG: FG-GAP-like repeat-containing protein [Vicinamibacteria bacterium]